MRAHIQDAARIALLPLFCVMSLPGVLHAATRNPLPEVAEPSGTIQVPAFSLPESSFLTPGTRAELHRQRIPSLDAFTTSANACKSQQATQPEELARTRDCQARAFRATPFYRNLRARYRVTVTSETMGGVPTEVFVPEAGIAPENLGRVLINLHGGSFSTGSHTNSQVESIPIAAVARIKVISIDYRLAPEHIFPAATEDVAAVYREALKHYPPRSVGLYGCSAGSALAAQAIAWFLQHDLPEPGAVGLFCFGAGRALDARSERWVYSDSAHIVGALTGTYDQLLEPLPYYRGLNLHNPLINPGDYDDIMRRFPATLLISGTRDYLLSSVVATHAQLTRLGVVADLHVWEGMSHAFFYFPDLPESREAYNVIAHFFGRYLAQQ